jgi:hypothetical protein
LPGPLRVDVDAGADDPEAGDSASCLATTAADGLGIRVCRAVSAFCQRLRGSGSFNDDVDRFMLELNARW